MNAREDICRLFQDALNGSYKLLFACGEDVSELNIADKPDLIVLDGSSERKFFNLCRDIRLATAAPILVINNSEEELDIIKWLEAGADDCVRKIFSTREVIARIRALIRRGETVDKEPSVTHDDASLILSSDGLEIDIYNHKVTRDRVPVMLNRREFNLLVVLVKNRNKALSREQLLEQAWGVDFGGYARTVDTHMWSLRQKLEKEPAHPKHLITVRGYGYRFEP